MTIPPPLAAVLVALSVSLCAADAAAFALGSGGRLQPGVGTPGAGGERQPKPEPTYTFTPAKVFDDVQGDASAGPFAERLTVSVKQEGQSPVSANIVLRVAPGKERDQRDAQVSIEAGLLRIYAVGGTKDAPGEMTAVSTANPAAFYRVALDGPPTLAALSAALNPLPLPTLAIYFARGGVPVSDPTPLTRKIAWEPTTVPINDPHPKITLSGTIEGKPGVSMVFEYQRDRLRFLSFTSPLPGAEVRTLSIVAAWIEPGDPKTWVVDVAGRTRVGSLAALGAKVEPAPPAKKPEEPPAKPEPAKVEPPKPEPAPTPDGTRPSSPAPPKVGPDP